MAPIPAWRTRVLASGQLWLANVVLAAGVASLYLAHAPAPRSLVMALFLYGGLVTCAALVSLPAGIATGIAAAAVRGARVRAGVAAVLWTATLVLLYVDTLLYGIFRYHFNGMVWNVLTTPGADEAVHVSARDYGIVLAGAAAVFALELLLFRRLARAAEGRRAAGRRPPFLLRPRAVWVLLLGPLLVLTTAGTAWADLVRDRQVMGLVRLYPVVPRITVKRFARKYFGVALEERPRVDVATEGILLAYPRAFPAVDPAGPRPNIVLIVIDSLRADLVAPETTPQLVELAARSVVFRDHLSSGNGTRFGIFGLLYGLHGSYWGPVYGEQRSPVLVDTLLALGYSLRILTSASMSYPEFRSTAWVRVEECVEDRIPPVREGGRDDGIPLRLAAWLDGRGAAAGPFFAMLLLDAPHQSYDFPAEFEVFRPSADDLTYHAIARAEAPGDVLPVYNRYRNAVRYADATTGAILEILRARGVLDDTVVLVTGDHGEEFLEHGFLGHTSNFTRAQLQVPLLLSGPGIAPGEVTGPTSHLDLPATLLELLGADPAVRAEWTLGGNLFSPGPERRRVAAGWDDLALIGPRAILHVPLAGYGGAGIDVYDEHWRLIADDAAILAAEGRSLARLALECRRFLR
ncbi:MAG: sulfatase-like hydrolase/transferase [Planctomycetota bacterium]